MALEVAAKIKQKNNGTFPIIDAQDVEVPSELGAVDNRLGTVLKKLSEKYNSIPVVLQSLTSVSINPATRNVWGTVNAALSIILAGAKSGIVNEYTISFVVGSSFSLSLSLGSGITAKWFGGEVPSWEPGSIYELSVIIDNNNALILWAKF